MRSIRSWRGRSREKVSPRSSQALRRLVRGRTLSVWRVRCVRFGNPATSRVAIGASLPNARIFLRVAPSFTLTAISRFAQQSPSAVWDQAISQIRCDRTPHSEKAVKKGGRDREYRGRSEVWDLNDQANIRAPKMKLLSG